MRKEIKAILAVSLLAPLSLVGCSSQLQMEQQNVQNVQLAAIHMALLKIQANQAQSIDLQKQQISLQETSNDQVRNAQINTNRR